MVCKWHKFGGWVGHVDVQQKKRPEMFCLDVKSEEHEEHLFL